jgi:hypothetical protein
MLPYDSLNALCLALATLPASNFQIVDYIHGLRMNPLCRPDSPVLLHLVDTISVDSAHEDPSSWQNK